MLFDGRRIWSFWLQRDGVEARRAGTSCPGRPALAQVPRRPHRAPGRRARAARRWPVRRGGPARRAATQRIAVVNAEGMPLSLGQVAAGGSRPSTPAAPSTSRRCSTRSRRCSTALTKAGIDAFLAYGTLLGAVREGKLIGHDSDADLGYVSRHTAPGRRDPRVLPAPARPAPRRGYDDHPLQRRRRSRSTCARPTASMRGLDVFGGFLRDGQLYLMGEIRTPFDEEWIFPLGTTARSRAACSRRRPTPTGSSRRPTARRWRVPDPAFHFETPDSTHRRLNGWFRGMPGQPRGVGPRLYSGRHEEVTREPSRVRWHGRVAEHGERPAAVVDLGCGRGAEALFFARPGSQRSGSTTHRRAASAVRPWPRPRDLPPGVPAR